MTSRLPDGNPGESSDATPQGASRTTDRNGSRDRSLIARIAVNTSWANTENRAARTAAARKAAEDRFAKQVDPNNELAPEERARRAENAKKAHMARMTLRAAQARRSRSA